MSPSWGTLSSLSASSMSDLLKGRKVWCCDDSRRRSRAGWKQQIPFVSGKEESDNICCRVMCSPLVLAMPRGPLSVNNKSGHLTAGHFTAATLTHTSSPGSSLPNLPCLDTKKCGMLQWNCSLAFGEIQKVQDSEVKLHITEQNRIGYRENDRLGKSGKITTSENEQKCWATKRSLQTYVNKQGKWWKALIWIGIHCFDNLYMAHSVHSCFRPIGEWPERPGQWKAGSQWRITSKRTCKQWQAHFNQRCT